MHISFNGSIVGFVVVVLHSPGYETSSNLWNVSSSREKYVYVASILEKIHPVLTELTCTIRINARRMYVTGENTHTKIFGRNYSRSCVWAKPYWLLVTWSDYFQSHFSVITIWWCGPRKFCWAGRVPTFTAFRLYMVCWIYISFIHKIVHAVW